MSKIYELFSACNSFVGKKNFGIISLIAASQQFNFDRTVIAS